MAAAAIARVCFLSVSSGFQVVILSCLFHLVVTPYFLLVDLLIETSSAIVPNLVLQFLWVLAHFCRLLIVIEPCHCACEEAKNTNPLVAQMLCADLDEFHKKQVCERRTGWRNTNIFGLINIVLISVTELFYTVNSSTN